MIVSVCLFVCCMWIFWQVKRKPFPFFLPHLHVVSACLYQSVLHFSKTDISLSAKVNSHSLLISIAIDYQFKYKTGGLCHYQKEISSTLSMSLHLSVCLTQRNLFCWNTRWESLINNRQLLRKSSAYPRDYTGKLKNKQFFNGYISKNRTHSKEQSDPWRKKNPN